MAISLSVKIWGDSAPLLTELEKVKKHLAKVSKDLTKMGQEMAEGLTLPIVAFGAIAVKNFGEAERALVSLEAQLRMNGKNVEETSKNYQDFAKRISEITTVSKDSAIQLMAYAESLGAPDAKKAAQDAIGLSKALGIDLHMATKLATSSQLGIYTQLGRLSPAIKAAKTGAEKAAIAQKMFADSFQVAQAQSKAGLGPMEQMKNSLEMLSEGFGKIIVTGLTPIVKAMKTFAEWMDSLGERTKKWIIGTMAVLAAIGPLLLILGKIPGVMVAILAGVKMLIVGFNGLMGFLSANPWVLLAAAIAAVGVAIYLHATRITAAEAAQKSLNDVTAQAIEQAASEKAQIEKLSQTAANETLSKKERLKAIKELQDISPQYFGSLTLETSTTEQLTIATQKCITSIIAKAKVEAAAAEIARLTIEQEKIRQGVSEASNRSAWQWIETQIGLIDATGSAGSQLDKATLIQQNATEQIGILDAQIKNLTSVIDQNAGSIDKSGKAYKNHNDASDDATLKKKAEQNALERLNEEIGILKNQYINEAAAGSSTLPMTAKRLEALQVQASYLQKVVDNQDKYVKGMIEEQNVIRTMTGATHKNDQGEDVSQMIPIPGMSTAGPSKVDPGLQIAQAIKPVDDLGAKIQKVKDGLNGVTGYLGPLAESFKNAFIDIGSFVQEAASGFADGWKSAIQSVGQMVNSVIGAIGEIISMNFDNQEQRMNDYYDKEKERIENSQMSEKEKAEALKKIGKQEEKERKKLMREQAKDQKTIAIIQAIINTALGITGALASGMGVAGIVLAAIVGALGAIQIAAIAAQPLPSLAEGGLAFAPSLAMVGDNPNARMDPEVIAPFSKIKQMFQGQQSIQVFGVLKGADIYLSNERGAIQVQRIRGY